MNQEHLAELLALARERNLTVRIDLEKMANQWAKLTKRGHLTKI